MPGAFPRVSLCPAYGLNSVCCAKPARLFMERTHVRAIFDSCL